MKPTADFLARAQTCIETVVRSKQAELLKLHGRVKTDYKADKSVVTKLDLAFEAELKQALAALDAGIGFEGEEFGAAGSRETFWLVDPIDGTESFVRGLPYVRNMVTLIDGGEPVFALVYNPVTDTLFVGSTGKGVTKNGRPVHVSSRPLDRARLELDSHIDNVQTANVMAAVARVVNTLRLTDEFTYVIDGRLDGHLVFNSRGKAWDFAPRALLMREAGARVANIGSDTYDYRQLDLLAASPDNFNAIMEAITNTLGQGAAS